MPEILASALERWRREAVTIFGEIRPEDYVLITPERDHVKPTWATKAFTRVLRHAEAHPKVQLEIGDRKLTPHSARHTLNSHLLGVKKAYALDVQHYLGWQSEAAKAITRVQAGYTDLRLLDTRAVAKAIDELYGPRAEAAELKIVR
jgi:integrase